MNNASNIIVIRSVSLDYAKNALYMDWSSTPKKTDSFKISLVKRDIACDSILGKKIR